MFVVVMSANCFSFGGKEVVLLLLRGPERQEGDLDNSNDTTIHMCIVFITRVSFSAF